MGNKTTMYSMRLSEAEKTLLEGLAGRFGESLSGYLVKSAKYRAVHDRPAAPDPVEEKLNAMIARGEVVPLGREDRKRVAVLKRQVQEGTYKGVTPGQALAHLRGKRGKKA